MKQTLIIFWAWGFVLTAYVCYERSQFHATHTLSRAPQMTTIVPQTQSHNWAPSNKFSD